MKARTSDGVEYLVRQIRPDDAQRERQFIAELSPESRYQRFMHMFGEPSAEMIERLVNVDGHERMALVGTVGAGDSERFIGIARYAADAGGRDCEFAICIADAWQCRGIASALAPALFRHAARQGFRSIYGYVLAGNARMLDLAQYLGLTLEPAAPGEGLVRAVRRL